MVTRETVATFLPGAAGLGGFWSPVIERLPPTWRSRLSICRAWCQYRRIPPSRATTAWSTMWREPGHHQQSLVGQSMGGFAVLLPLRRSRCSSLFSWPSPLAASTWRLAARVTGVLNTARPIHRHRIGHATRFPT